MDPVVPLSIERLKAAGLAEPDGLLFGTVDDGLCWNGSGSQTAVLAPVFEQLDIAALLCCRPAEPYGKVIDFLAARAGDAIRPEDTESRTFLHEILVADSFSTAAVTAALARRKSVILPGGYVVAAGAVTAEQAYLHFSSVCFATFVKFLSSLLVSKRTGTPSVDAMALLEEALPLLPASPAPPYGLMRGPFNDELTAQTAMAEAGRCVVRHQLVDSFFGNISYRVGETLYISQTGSALDALLGNIDPAAMDGRSSAAITASSELSAHLQIVKDTGVRAVLHGHPRFAVALSLDCGVNGCTAQGECHVRCPEKRYVGDTPIIPGEVGTGPSGIATTLPPAMQHSDGVIVYGHGVFTVGRVDFNDAFDRLVAIEDSCRNEFLKRLGIGGFGSSL